MDKGLIELLSQETGGKNAGRGACYVMPENLFASEKCASDAIQEALDTHAHVAIPYLPFPVLLNRPICLNTGNRLTVYKDTVMHLMDGCGGCMVRNAHPVDGRYGEFDCSNPDTDMLVEGGVWENAKSGVSPYDPSPIIQDFGRPKAVLVDGNGNETNVAGSEGGAGAFLGVFFFNNAERFTVRKLTVRRCNFYAILVSGGSHFVAEDIYYDHNKMDGIHVNGPSAYGLIQRMRGKTGDDFVALNGWDWGLSAVSFGAIHHMLIQDLDCEGDELRLLPGRKTYRDGTQTECPIYDCFYRRIHNAYCVKMYQQPNCTNDLLGEEDKSDIAGELKRISFEDLGLDALTETGLGEVQVGALFEVCADCTDISYENVRVGVDEESFRAAGMRLVEVGPKSSTWKRGHTDPKMWAELFDTELIVTAEDMRFKNISFAGKPCVNADTIIGCHKLTPNPDYPNTTPKGGTGYGILGKITIE